MNQGSKWAGLSRHFSKGGLQIANRPMRRCSTPLPSMEMQIEVTMTHHLLRVNISLAIIKTKTVKDDQCRENMERLYAGESSVT